MLLRRRVPLAVLARCFLALLAALIVVGALVVHATRSGASHSHAATAAARTAATGAKPTGGHGARPAGASSTTRGSSHAHHPPGSAAIVPASASSAQAGHRSLAVEQPDPYAAQSFPVTRSHHAAAVTPATAGSMIAAGAPSDAQVQQELAQMQAATNAANAQQASAARGGSIGGNGTVSPPAGVPAVVARVIAGANAITDFPYVYGGGHASFVDNAYDCSGSVSYALAAGGLLSIPETSGQLESWGAPGPGKWITVEANGGHTYMYIDGLRFDTAGRSGPFSSRWQTGILTNAGFVTRHFPGL